MRRYFSKIILAIICLSTLSACTKAPICDCFESAGSQSSQVRYVPNFKQLYVEDNINVFISTGNSELLTIEGGKNLIPNIAANVSGGILTLKNNNICNWLRSYKKSIINVYITMPALTSITNSGYGNIQSVGTLTFDSLALTTNNSSGGITLTVNSKYINASFMLGTASLTLSGYAKSFTASFWEGTGFMYNSNLETKYSFIESNTTGDCYVSADSSLGVQIYSTGNVYYTGNPTVGYYPKGGTGKLIKD